MQQAATGASCITAFEPLELKPLTTFREMWLDDWYAVDEQGMDLKQYPIRAFIDLDDGSSPTTGEIFLYPRPSMRSQKRAAPGKAAKT